MELNLIRIFENICPTSAHVLSEKNIIQFKIKYDFCRFNAIDKKSKYVYIIFKFFYRFNIMRSDINIFRLKLQNKN